MKTIVYLKGNEELALKLALKRNSNNRNYKEENIRKAINELSIAKLRYNTKNGTTYIGKEWTSKPSNKNDIEQYDSIEEVIEWELLNEIMNSAGRLERGLKAIG